MCARLNQTSDKHYEKCGLWLLCWLLFFNMPARLLATFSFRAPTVPLSLLPEYGCPAHLNTLALLPLSSSSLCLPLRPHFSPLPHHLLSFSGRFGNFTLQCQGTIKVHCNMVKTYLSIYFCWYRLQSNCDFSHKRHCSVSHMLIRQVCKTLYLCLLFFSTPTLSLLDFSVAPTPLYRCPALGVLAERLLSRHLGQLTERMSASDLTCS